MKKIEQITSINKAYGILIGNFDGVHLGHQYLISKFVDFCHQNDLKSVIVSFTPHPVVYFSSAKHYLLYPQNIKEHLLSQCNIDYYLELKFNKEISSLKGEDFISMFLDSEYLKGILIGHDFCLGKGRNNCFEFFHEFSLKHHLKFQKVDSFYFEEKIISSSLIRDLVRDGDFELVERYLGRPLEYRGFSEKGRRIGRQLGYPTVNLATNDNVIYPDNGVYISKIFIAGRWLHSISNIGFNPTVSDTSKLKFETYILDFEQTDLTISDVSVILIKKIRSEAKFNSVEDLKKQISKDVNLSMEYFRNETRPNR